MNFDYCDIGATQAQLQPIQLLDLATNIITDWLPGTPNSLAPGFANILGSILNSEMIAGNNQWVLQSIMAGFEKQWKQVSSWILGVAFCRQVLQLKGYTWWAPVSAFRPRSTQYGPLIPYWSPGLQELYCRVEYPTPKLSRWLPDYIVARQDPASGSYEISFAESKGCRKPFQSQTTAPLNWRNQARNAEFFYNGVKQPILQNIVIATRVNPGAKRSKTRRIYVRAWNSRNSENIVSFDVFREILLAHYFGVCERIGMTATAQLLVLNNYTETDNQNAFRHLVGLDNVSDLRQRLEDEAFEEVEERRDSRLGSELYFTGRVRSIFPLDDRFVRLGLSSAAMSLVRSLQKGNLLDGSQLLTELRENVISTKSLIGDRHDFSVRSDGVVTTLE